MQFTALEVLYLALTFAVLLLAVSIAVFFSHASKVMKNVSRMTDDISDMTEVVHKYFMVPFDAIKKVKKRMHKEDE